MRISDWISDVCSSDLARPLDELLDEHAVVAEAGLGFVPHRLEGVAHVLFAIGKAHALAAAACRRLHHHRIADAIGDFRSEEHTSELQSLMRISYAVFCLKKKKNINN